MVKEHQAPADRKRRLYPKDVNACYICQRIFKDPFALQQHLTSVKHYPLSDMGCLASSKCRRRFTSPSALLGHLESGACSSGVCKRDIDKLVLTHDTERLITTGPSDGRRLVEIQRQKTAASPSSSRGLIRTPLSSAPASPILTPMSHDSPYSISQSGSHSGGPQAEDWQYLEDRTPSIASNRPILTPISLNNTSLSPPSWFLNPSVTEEDCPSAQLLRELRIYTLAHSTHADHRSGYESLELQRRPSIIPRFDGKIYHCPVTLPKSALTKKAEKSFSTLSGLAMHIESGACGDGQETMKVAMEIVEEKLTAMGIGGIRLLK